MRKIIFSLVILLALFLAVEIGITLFSERGLEKVMRSQYGLPSTLKVSINSFPLTLSLARNHLGEIRLSWDGDLYFTGPDGVETHAPYHGNVAVYDIELNMPSLLKGRLDIRKISRIKTMIVLDEASLNEAFGAHDRIFIVEEGEVFEIRNGIRIKYEVEVLDDTTMAIEPVLDSTNGVESSENTQPGVHPSPQLIKAEALPFQAGLQSITSEGDLLILEISIPEWEGYL